jgi:transposase
VAFEAWARKHLRPTDEVVLEATSNAWYIYDLLQPLVARVVVANPYAVKLIAASLVKTDRRDTLILARLLAANLIPEVWVFPAFCTMSIRAPSWARGNPILFSTSATPLWVSSVKSIGCVQSEL